MTAVAIALALALVTPPVPADPAPTPTPASTTRATQAYEGEEPSRQPRRLNPSQFAAANKLNLLVGSQRRHIVLRADRLDLMIGAHVEWSGPVGAEVTQFADLAAMVRRSPHPDWLTEPAPGLFELRTALVQAAGTRLLIATPRVREIRMIATGRIDEEVYLTGVSAQATINGTTVTSWRPAGGPDPTPSIRRPFVSYDQPGSALYTTAAHFSYLGGDSILAYGVTWGRGSVGSSTESTYDHNFFGAYTNAAIGVLFLRNVFRDNDLYGLDPHSESRGLKVLDNMAFNNGSHGIIFSEDVVDSVVTGNRSFGNRVNGIMMDERSDRNLITRNSTWSNVGDGIVVQNSDDVTVRSNLVTGNRVGVRVTGSSLRTDVAGNRLIGNKRGIEIYAGPAAARALTGPNVVSRNIVVGDRTGHGIAVKDFAGVHIAGNQVTHYVNGVLVSGRSPGAQVAGNRLVGQVRGIEVDARAVGARLGGNVVRSAAERGLVLRAADAVSTGDAVSGSDIAVDVRGDATIAGVRIRDGRRGINIAGRAVVTGADITVQEYGLNVETAGHLALRSSTIVARNPVNGIKRPPTASNTLNNPPPPFQWLALAGALFIVVAVGLHLVSRRRTPSCHLRPKATPSGVRNAW